MKFLIIPRSIFFSGNYIPNINDEFENLNDKCREDAYSFLQEKHEKEIDTLKEVQSAKITLLIRDFEEEKCALVFEQEQKVSSLKLLHEEQKNSMKLEHLEEVRSQSREHLESMTSMTEKIESLVEKHKIATELHEKSCVAMEELRIREKEILRKEHDNYKEMSESFLLAFRQLKYTLLSSKELKSKSHNNEYISASPELFDAYSKLRISTFNAFSYNVELVNRFQIFEDLFIMKYLSTREDFSEIHFINDEKLIRAFHSTWSYTPEHSLYDKSKWQKLRDVMEVQFGFRF